MLVRSSADLGSIVHHSWIEAWRESAPGCSVVARGLILRTLLCGVLAVGPFRLAAQTTSTLQGTVTDEQHLAVVGAGIMLSGSMSITDIQTTTDAIGSYRITGLPAGIYWSKPGGIDST